MMWEIAVPRSNPKVMTNLYTDGGLVLRNPSTIGGAWAYVITDQNDEEMLRASGAIKPMDIGMEAVTNQYVELLAVYIGMQQLPDGFAGKILLDSDVTRYRLDRAKRGRFRGIPAEFEAKILAQMARMGDYKLILLQSHPKLAELEAGISTTGRPVSKHNKACDYLCRGTTKRLQAEHERWLKARNQAIGI